MIKKIINASAGTGKTYTILEEVLKKELGKKVDIKEIKQGLKDSIFLSFSKAAVEELKSRIHERLAELADKGEKTVENELSDFLGARVYTIHAFSLELARIFRYELGMPAGVDFIPEGDTTAWKETVKDFFKEEYDSESLRKEMGFKTGAENVLFDILTILGNTGNIVDFVGEKGENVFYVHELGGKVPEDPAEKEIIKVLNKLGIKAEQGLDYEKIKNRLQEKLFERKASLDIFIKDYIPKIEELKKKKDRLAAGYDPKKDGSPSYHEVNCRKAIDEIESKLDAYMKKTGIMEVFPLMDMAGGMLAKLICHIGNQKYIPAMMKDGLFDFDAIVFLVINLISKKGRKWVMRRLTEEEMQVKNLYIDEAQDSDIVQNYLVSVLAGGDEPSIKVTVVGDIKQSIYQWRNAYPEEFRAMYKEAEAMGRADKLQKTWRVENKENLDYFNGLFERLKNIAGKYWDYEKSRDELKSNKKVMDPQKKKDVRLIRMFSDTEFSGMKDDIKEYLNKGSSGILAEKRNYIRRAGIDGFIKDIKRRIQTDTGAKEGAAGTVNPEKYLVKTMAYTRISERLDYLPYLMLFTTPGNFIRSAGGDVKGGDIINSFRNIIKRTQDTYDFYSEYGIARSVYLLMNKYGLWKYMLHGDEKGPDKNVSFKEIRRTVNTVLASLYLEEKNNNKALYGIQNMAAELLDESPAPFEWFGMPGKKAGKGDKELVTVHGSKGLQYDNTLVFTDLVENVKSEPSFKEEVYNYLYCAEFKDIISDKPKVSLDYFPYFGSLPARIIRDYFDSKKAPWKNGLKSYEKAREKHVSENFNTLYVAFTRARDGVWIVDCPKNKKRYGKNANTHALINEVSVIVEDIDINIDLPQKARADYGRGEIFYYEMREALPLIEVEDDTKEKSVRQLIKEGKNIKFHGTCEGTCEGFDRMEIGTAAHEYVQQALSRINKLSDFAGEIEKMAAVHENEKKAREIVMSDATLKELEKIRHIVGAGADIQHEVPVWGIAGDGVFVRGVIDTLVVDKDKVYIIEYKTVFDDETAQKKLSMAQMDLYEQLLGPVVGDKKVEKVSVLLKK